MRIGALRPNNSPCYAVAFCRLSVRAHDGHWPQPTSLDQFVINWIEAFKEVTSLGNVSTKATYSATVSRKHPQSSPVVATTSHWPAVGNVTSLGKPN